MLIMYSMLTFLLAECTIEGFSFIKPEPPISYSLVCYKTKISSKYNVIHMLDCLLH